MQTEDRVQNRLKASSKLTIMPVVVAFQIDFEQIKMGTEVLQCFGRPVSVGYKSGHQTGRLGLLENGCAPFCGNQGLIIGADYDPRAFIAGILDDCIRCNRLRRRIRVRIPQRLRGSPILAIAAVEIASQHPEAKGA